MVNLDQRKIPLLNLISYQPDINKIYLNAKGPSEAKYWFLVNKLKKVGLKYSNDPKVFNEYWIDMQHVYQNITEYNPGKKRKVLIIFHDLIWCDMISNFKI